jgi:anti-anti-sigma regulatory factor
MVKKVLLASEFGSNIFTRSTISSFFEKINDLKEKEIVLDFSSIEFISRSCADEYIKRKQDSKKKIVEANMSKEVCSMFKAVQNQYKKAGVDISFNICSTNNKSLIPA